nr:MAG TPA: active helicase ring shaped helicase [Caudoviricetes sp.]
MVNYSELSRNELISDDVINGIMDEQDAVTREQMKFALLDRAAEFGKATEQRVAAVLKAAEKELKKMEKEAAAVKAGAVAATEKGADHETAFLGLPAPYGNLKCGKYEADMGGIFDPTAVFGDRTVCPHPILPVETVINVDGGPQKTKLLFNRGFKWEEFVVNKSVTASRSRITELADVGIAVTSETAKGLVKFLSAVESLNYSDLPKTMATAKMGWHGDGFMPFTSGLQFDSTSGFDGIFGTIRSCGSFNKWMDLVLKIRAGGRTEAKLALAASFASVLLKPCGLLPFWVDLWGTSGGGKSVCGMLAASVWADPEIGKYISKFDFTAVGLEAKAGFLNDLPFVIDDTAEMRKRLKDDFAGVIYQLASGSGKERSNTKLALAAKQVWDLIIICSGESPIISDRSQGGAVNRVLEYEVGEGHIFDDGQATAATLRSNFGFAGPLFVNVLSKYGIENAARLQREQFDLIKSDIYEDKQLLSLSVLLAADKIATDNIFKDGAYLTFGELEKTLVDKNTMSENERCYEYILGEVAVNSLKFTDISGDRFGEVWGRYLSPADGSSVAIISNVLARMCEAGGFNLKAFLSWAAKKGLLLSGKDKNRASKPVRMPDGHIQRCYCLLIRPEEAETKYDDDLII